MLEIELLASHRLEVNKLPKYFRFHDFECDTNLSSFHAHWASTIPVWLFTVALIRFLKVTSLNICYVINPVQFLLFSISPSGTGMKQLFSTPLQTPSLHVTCHIPVKFKTRSTGLRMMSVRICTCVLTVSWLCPDSASSFYVSYLLVRLQYFWPEMLVII
jgi:hypothetical protein